MKALAISIVFSLLAMPLFAVDVQIQTPNVQGAQQLNPAVVKAACLANCQKTFDECSAQQPQSSACSRNLSACKLGCERKPAPSNP